MELIIVFAIALIIGFVAGWFISRNEANHRISEIKNFSQESLKNMEAKFNLLADQVLENQKQKLEKDSNSQLNLLLKPLKDNLDQLDKSIRDVNDKSIAQSTSFQVAIKRLEEQTSSIGKEANNLARALKNDSKVMGDWGEMILSNILERSGLREGEEFEIQKNFKTAEGENVRPDVVVKFPEGRSIVIDSKVSLKDFTDYVNAETNIDRENALKRHLVSVRQHINELSQQNYPKDVKGSPEYVIMFMPSESSYITAVQADENLNSYAWSKRVILVCPNILIMTLQIVNNIWQSARQAKNVEKIVSDATDIYYQFALFTEIFAKVGRDLDTLQKDYETSRKRLTDGKGNLIHRFENMKALGLSPKKEIDESLRN